MQASQARARAAAPSPHAALSRAPRARRVAVRAAAAGSRQELPIFPLGVVALPHATGPLMIFEPWWG